MQLSPEGPRSRVSWYLGLILLGAVCPGARPTAPGAHARPCHRSQRHRPRHPASGRVPFPPASADVRACPSSASGAQAPPGCGRLPEPCGPSARGLARAGDRPHGANTARSPAGLGDAPQAVLQAIRGYVHTFFGCRECGEHFEEMARESMAAVETPDQAVLWLWRKHNLVNSRLAGERAPRQAGGCGRRAHQHHAPADGLSLVPPACPRVPG